MIGAPEPFGTKKWPSGSKPALEEQDRKTEDALVQDGCETAILDILWERETDFHLA